MLSMALGAGETTLLKLTTAYATLANGGRQVRSTFIDRIQTATARPSGDTTRGACGNCQQETGKGKRSRSSKTPACRSSTAHRLPNTRSSKASLSAARHPTLRS